MAGAKARNRRHRYGRHVYRLEDFGLDGTQVDESFGFYRQRYDIAVEAEHEA